MAFKGFYSMSNSGIAFLEKGNKISNDGCQLVDFEKSLTFLSKSGSANVTFSLCITPMPKCMAQSSSVLVFFFMKCSEKGC